MSTQIMHLKCGIIHHAACSILNFVIQVVQNRATTERGQKGELPWVSHFRGTTKISSNCKENKAFCLAIIICESINVQAHKNCI